MKEKVREGEELKKRSTKEMKGSVRKINNSSG